MNGAIGLSRTGDARVFSATLYRLSQLHRLASSSLRFIDSAGCAVVVGASGFENGVGARARTPVSGFGDRRSAR